MITSNLDLYFRSEYGTIWRAGFGVLAYIVTQVCKLLIIAAVMTPNPLWSHLIDCIGMYWFLVNQQKASVASVKVLSELSYTNVTSTCLNSLFINI